MIDAGRCAHVVVRRDGGGRCVAELQQPDPGHVRGACARLTRLVDNRNDSVDGDDDSGGTDDNIDATPRT